MAWPSGTKASTTNLDQGSDKPSLARADIKQNVDNVNAIIDTFNISTPSDGDLLQYSSSTGQWEQVASSSLGGGTSLSVIWDTGSMPTSISVGDNVLSISSSAGSNGNISKASSTTWTFTETGTYYWRFSGIYESTFANVSFELKNNTQSTYTQWDTIGSETNDVENFFWGWRTLSVTSVSDTYSMVIQSDSSSFTGNALGQGWGLEFIKIS